MKRIIDALAALGVLWALLVQSPLAHAQQPVIPGVQVAGPKGNALGFLQTGAFQYKNITTDTTTVVKASAGVLHTITFNNPVATETVTLYDNTAASGTKIGTITVPASPQPQTLMFDVAFTIGLTIVTATAASDITVSYQ